MFKSVVYTVTKSCQLERHIHRTDHKKYRNVQ